MEEMGIANPDMPAVHAVIPREELTGLNDDQASKAKALFEKYKKIFAKDDYNLACEEGVTHHIDTGDYTPIRL